MRTECDAEHVDSESLRGVQGAPDCKQVPRLSAEQLFRSRSREKRVRGCLYLEAPGTEDPKGRTRQSDDRESGHSSSTRGQSERVCRLTRDT